MAAGELKTFLFAAAVAPVAVHRGRHFTEVHFAGEVGEVGEVLLAEPGEEGLKHRADPDLVLLIEIGMGVAARPEDGAFAGLQVDDQEMSRVPAARLRGGDCGRYRSLTSVSIPRR